MELNLELDKVIQNIKKAKAKKVMIQLPDGLKDKADVIQDKIQEETESEVMIWAGSCFGACDVPEGIEKLSVDLLIQWGHSEWNS